MTFFESAYNHIKDTVGYLPVEKGGILLGDRGDFVVRKFIFDRNGRTSTGAYDPDMVYINKIVKEEWNKNRLAYLGTVHSHPNSHPQLTKGFTSNIGDIAYIKTILKAIPDLQQLLVPIIFSEASGEYKIFPYVAHRDDPDNYQLADLEIIPDVTYKIENNPINKREFFPDLSRMEGAIDIDLMKKTHVVCVGIGGANQICESLVRIGLGKLTAIDFDNVEASNLSTQGFYLNDIGKSKVEALGNHLKTINPDIEYNGINADFLKLSKEQINSIIKDTDLLLMMTDNFFAQAKGNRIILKYRIPGVFAMMYERARCSEISFVIPGITPGCHRCAVSSRYKAYENGYKNDINSKGSTIFHTQYLNSVIGLLVLAILHRNTHDLEFSNWFGSSWDRNLIQLRSHPQYSIGEGQIFNRTFKGIDRVFNFDSIWQKIEPESYPKYPQPCPDCGGIGDLNLTGRFISLLQNPCFRRSDWLEDDTI